MKKGLAESQKILKDISKKFKIEKVLESKKKRRAAVFYLDRNSSDISMLNWWIYTWKFIGLNTIDQAFDIIVMTYPEMVHQLPRDFIEIKEYFTIPYDTPGQCFFKEYIGISWRDNNFDTYFNSMECLVGPGTDFLSYYDVLLRADLDTFPAPKLLDWWPTGVVVDR